MFFCDVKFSYYVNLKFSSRFSDTSGNPRPLAGISRTCIAKNDAPPSLSLPLLSPPCFLPSYTPALLFLIIFSSPTLLLCTFPRLVQLALRFPEPASPRTTPSSPPLLLSFSPRFSSPPLLLFSPSPLPCSPLLLRTPSPSFSN